MADRIFINKDPGEYSKRELNRINWEQVGRNMVAVRTASQNGATITPFGIVTGVLNERLAQFEAPVQDDPTFGDDVVNNAGGPMGAGAGEGDVDFIQKVADYMSNPDQEIDPETEEAVRGMLDNPGMLEMLADEMGRGDDVAGLKAELQSMVGSSMEDTDFAGPEGVGPGGVGEETFSPEPEFDAARIAKRKLPEMLAKYKFKKKDEGAGNGGKDDAKTDEDGDGEADAKDEKEMVRKGKEAKASTFVFNDPNQLSIAALNGAKAEGNEALYRAILAARQERRIRAAERFASATLDQLTREAKSRRRTAAKAEPAEGDKEVQAQVNEQTDFAAPVELSTAQKSVFAAKARELGFPDKYIQSMIGGRQADVSEDAIRRIAESDGTYQEKCERVASMLREAKLSSEDKERFLRYWVEELGYPRNYIEKMVADK
jgi:hypothetical protein